MHLTYLILPVGSAASIFGHSALSIATFERVLEISILTISILYMFIVRPFPLDVKTLTARSRLSFISSLPYKRALRPERE